MTSLDRTLTTAAGTAAGTLGLGALWYAGGALIRVAELHGRGYPVGDGLGYATQKSLSTSGTILIGSLLLGGFLVTLVALAVLSHVPARTDSSRNLRKYGPIGILAAVSAVAALILAFQGLWYLTAFVVALVFVLPAALVLMGEPDENEHGVVTALALGALAFAAVLLPGAVAYKLDRPGSGTGVVLVSNAAERSCLSGELIGQDAKQVFVGRQAAESRRRAIIAIPKSIVLVTALGTETCPGRSVNGTEFVSGARATSRQGAQPTPTRTTPRQASGTRP